MKRAATLKQRSHIVDKALLSLLPKKNEHPTSLSKAMHYAVFPGGKRLRPLLALAACEAVGGDARRVMSAACALEMIHSYSLIHDDLPCMDDDALRRGKPSCHAKFGEVTALLAGDALLTQAFKVLSSAAAVISRPYKERQLTAIQWIAVAVGSQGMVGGQALDMEFQDKETDLPTVEYINTHKTGALLAVATRVGAYLGGGHPKEVEALYRYGRSTGLLFQIVDDIMDHQGYAKVIGEHDAKQIAATLLEKAKRELKPFGKKAALLHEISGLILRQKN